MSVTGVTDPVVGCGPSDIATLASGAQNAGHVRPIVAPMVQNFPTNNYLDKIFAFGELVSFFADKGRLGLPKDGLSRTPSKRINWYSRMRSVTPNHVGDLQKRSAVRFEAGIRRILAPTDLTARSRNVVKYAARLAARCAAHLTVLHVYREPYNVAYLRGSPAYASMERHLQDTKNALESFGEEIRERYGDCRTEFRIGIPCEEIIEAAKDLQIDMLVISTHPHKWFRRLAYGSNEEELLRRAPCPVLLMHEDKHSSWFLN